jgi:Xaa-Pro aminopeptidase
MRAMTAGENRMNVIKTRRPGWRSALAILFSLGCSLPAQAQTALPPAWAQSDWGLRDAETAAPALPPVLPLRERAALIDQIIEDRLDQLIPQIMREQGVAMWVLMAREYFEEPVVASMLDARSMAARRRTILVFFDPGDGQPVERLTVSRYGLAGLFEAAWDPDVQPDQWAAVADIIAERDPASIAINFSDLTAFGDGMTLSQYRAMSAALPELYQDRLVSGETLAVRWLETRVPTEVALYPAIVRTAHALIARAFSREVITPGQTTADDVVWWYRDELARLGLEPWFHPSVSIQRQGRDGMLSGDETIQPGDLLWTDFGITYLRLNTDTQHLAYVLRPGETQAPQGLVRGLQNTNRVQDILLSHYEAGLSGNDILERTRADALAEGLDPSIYTHPIGLHGHGAGPAIGFWDNQAPTDRGAGSVNANTAWSIELTSFSEVAEWGGQRVDFRSEENAFFDGETIRFIDGRQTELTLIPSD